MLGIAACKYDEGPLVSFVSKTARLTQTWIPSDVMVNEVPVAAVDSFREVTFRKDGGCEMVFTDYTRDYSYAGTWQFAADKSILSIAAADTLSNRKSYANDWTILGLKQDRLKVSYYQRNATGTKDAYVVTFEPGF